MWLAAAIVVASAPCVPEEIAQPHQLIIIKRQQ
jgi:hypothetical protein